MSPFGNALTALSGKLCEASQKQYLNPYTAMAWPEALAKDVWCFSPEWISLYGSPTWEGLPETAQKQLSFWETVNFFSLNIHGEKTLLAGLAKRLYRQDFAELAPYLHHFLDEENKHMVYFGRFCTQYGGKIYPSRSVAFPREYAPGEQDFLFFCQILIFEEIVDAYNVHMAQDERLDPLVRAIHLQHHKDEARHLAFGRLLVQDLFQHHGSQWSGEVLEGVRQHVAGFFRTAWREYYNPDVYRDAGLSEPYERMDEAWATPTAQDHRQTLSARCVAYLLEHQILVTEPDLR
jgi:hypothetical protein